MKVKLQYKYQVIQYSITKTLYWFSIGVEVFGSWKDIAPKLKTIRSDSNLEQQIMDAIQDGGVSSLTPPTSSGDKRQHVPLFTGYRQQPSKTQVGFHPPSAMM